MRRVEQLVARAQRETENDDPCSNDPIIEQEYIDYLNDAQDQLQSAIARQHKDVFIAFEDYDVISSQESYPMPEDALLDNRISAVWYSRTGNVQELRKLRSGTLMERVFDRTFDPVMYIRVAGKVLLNPVPKKTTANGLRLAYVKKLPNLDVRRAKVLSVTTLGNTITALTLDPNSDFQRDALLEENYFSITNRDGDQTMKAIPWDNIDATTGVVTVSAGFTFKDGETISVGDYVVRGKDATNRSEMPDTCERYLQAYCNWKILKRDSSQDAGGQTEELLAMQDEIIEIFKETDDDIKFPAIEDAQFIDDEDLWNYY